MEPSPEHPVTGGTAAADGEGAHGAPWDAATFRARRAELCEQLGPGPALRAGLSALADRWLADLFAAAGVPPGRAALVAVGGYGRRTLSPGSDLDVVLLHAGPAAPGEPALDDLAAAVFRPVWDSGVELDHSVRTVPEARAVAAEDLKAALGMLDLRHLAGDGALTTQLRSLVLADWRAGARERLPQVLATSSGRGDRSGELAFLLEPDLKESRGGLRDVVALRAVAASWVADIPRARVDAAERHLLDVRDALHLSTGRPRNRLLLQEQDAVAARLGVLDADDLMLRVAEAARTISWASEVTAHRVERVVTSPRTGPGRRRAPELTPLGNGLAASGGEVVLADPGVAGDPAVVLHAAAAAAQGGLVLAPATTERLARAARRLPVPWPEDVRHAFVALLGAGPALVPVWESLDQAGLIAPLLPDWDRLRSRPQRNAVHRWTVDRHLVETAVQASALARRVSRPDLLLVAAVLHDVGKGWPGDHSEVGAEIAGELAARMGFDGEDVATIVTLIRHHLLLVTTATRRDLSDPATLKPVADVVGRTDLLDLLAALTEADARATGPAAWTTWRQSLVRELVLRLERRLAGVPPPPPPELSAEQRDLLRTADLLSDRLAVRVEAHGAGHRVTVVAADRTGLLALVAGVLSLQRLAVRAARTRSVGRSAVMVCDVLSPSGEEVAAEVLADALRSALAGRLDVAERLARREAAYPVPAGVLVPAPTVAVLDGASERRTALEVRAHDRPGLLHAAAAALAGARVEVRAAVVSTLGAEAVDVFYVAGPDGGPLTPDHARTACEHVLAALT